MFVVNVVSGPGAGEDGAAGKDHGLADASAADESRPSSATWRPTTTPGGWRASGAPVKQIVTGTVCHLEAEWSHAPSRAGTSPGWTILFIENVGNLVCPASFDLGEDLALVLFSVTEGEDKPLKYPTIYQHGRRDADLQARPGRRRRIRPDAGPEEPRGGSPRGRRARGLGP